MNMVIGFGKKKPPTDDEAAPEEAAPSLSGMASRRAAKGVLAAVESGDVSALDKALRAHYAACEGGDEAEADEGEE